jgi:hypothetical protein
MITQVKYGESNLKEASNLIAKGLAYQDKGNFDKARANMQEGIEIIKKILIKENSNDKEIIFDYYSLYEKFLQNVNYDEE